jgi:hypothetical protein
LAEKKAEMKAVSSETMKAEKMVVRSVVMMVGNLVS